MVMETFAHQSAAFHWYCVQTKPRNEKRALLHITRAGIETLNPLMETYQPRNGASKKVLEPLFPGYFFAQFDLARHYPTVRWARGVRRVLGNQKGPTPVTEEIIHEIRKRIDSHGLVRRPYDLKPEDSVKIKAGPLKDLVGIFERWLPKEGRIRILLRLLGYERSVELNYSHVEKVWNCNRPNGLSESVECP